MQVIVKDTKDFSLLYYEKNFPEDYSVGTMRLPFYFVIYCSYKNLSSFQLLRRASLLCKMGVTPWFCVLANPNVFGKSF